MNKSAFLLLIIFVAGFPERAIASDSEYPNSCFSPCSLQEKSSTQSAGIVVGVAQVVACDNGNTQPLSSENFQTGADQNPKHFQSPEYRPSDSPPATKPGIRWKPLLGQMLFFTSLEHAMRMTEEKTREKLGGPFFADWKESVSTLSGWDDGGKFFTNYVAHPMQGAVAAFIYKNNDTRYNTLMFDTKDKRYWNMAGLALVFATVHSLQFEIGPYSEASFGNVGEIKEDGSSTMAWIDMVATPILGTAWTVAEDALDKHLVQRIERHSRHKVVYIPARILLNPVRSFSNLMRFKSPFFRDDRR